MRKRKKLTPASPEEAEDLVSNMQKIKSLENLEESLSKLPSVGKKSAERMAYAMLNFSDEDLEEIGNAIINFKKRIKVCPICGMITENDKCEICADESRDQTTLMIVSYPKDVFTLEKSETYHGLYHILNGEISLSKGMRVDELNLQSLYRRLEEGKIKEIIIATNPTVDGETTALYLNKTLELYDVNVTRLAYGLQMGGSLDYVDPLTLSKALEGRHKL